MSSIVSNPLTPEQLLQKTVDMMTELEQLAQYMDAGKPFESLLQHVMETIKLLEKEAKNYSIPHRVELLCANLYDYKTIISAYDAEKQKKALYYDFIFHFCSLCKLLQKEISYVVEKHVNQASYPDLYRDLSKVDHAKLREKQEKAKLEVSIVLLAYNNLTYTKQCVESILEHVGNVSYELILVDNGSTDETKSYFESIPDAKVIHLPHNIHLVKGFNIGMMAAEGKYIAAVCNDFIFTENWLTNLLVCIKSDELIGFVAPGATNISNYQQIPIPFYSIEDFQLRAKQYNQSDASKWQERVVLLPNVLFCPTALLEEIGYYDTRYYRGEFLDDDISFRIRRAGYKLVYCADTVTHHYGSLTTASDHATQSLQEGRHTFQQRYGLDAWLDARKNQACQFIEYQQLSNVKNMLGIDVKCGASYIEVSNQLWAIHGSRPNRYASVADPHYVTDLQTICTEVNVHRKIEELPQAWNHFFDLIYIELALDSYDESMEQVVSRLAELLKPNGQLIICLHNPLSIEMLKDTLLYPQLKRLNGRVTLEKFLLIARGHHLYPAYRYDFRPLYNEKRDAAVSSFIQYIGDVNSQLTRHIETTLQSHYSLIQLSYMPSS